MTPRDRDLDGEIMAWMEAGAPARAPESLTRTLLDVTAAPPAPAAVPQVHGRPLRLAGGLAAAAVVAAIAVGGLLLRQSIGPAATSTPADTARTPSPTNPATPTPATVTEIAGTGWSLVQGALPAAARPFGDGEVSAFGLSNGGFVAFLRPAGSDALAVFRSDDGIAWTHTADLPLPGGTKADGVRAIAQSGDVTLAIGSLTGNAGVTDVAWTTTDLSTWTLAPSTARPAAFGAITGGPNGFVAGDAADNDSALWRSTDGSTWTRAGSTAELLGQRAMVTQLASDAHGYVATGLSGSDERTTIWHSIDGVAWTRVYEGQPFDPSTGRGRAIDQLVRTSDGSWVARGGVSQAPGGGCGDCSKINWTSQDGVHWTMGPEFTEPGMIVRVGAAPGGFVAAGRPDVDPAGDPMGQLAVWTSTDAQQWAAVPLPAIGPVAVRDVASDGRRVVVLAADQAGLPVILTASDIAATSNTPTPTPTGDSSTFVSRAMAFASGTQGILVGGDAFENSTGIVQSTTDGGKSWTVERMGQGSFDAASVAASAWWIGRTCTSGEACEPGIWSKSVGSSGWRQASSEPAISLSFLDAQHGWAILATGSHTTGPQGGDLAETADGGRTWARKPSPCAADTGSPVSVSFPDAEHGWVACVAVAGAGNAAKSVVATTDGGRTWTVRASAPGGQPGVGSIGTFGYLAGIAMGADGAGFNWQGRFLAQWTTDGGRTWESWSYGGDNQVHQPVAGSILPDGTWLLCEWDGSRQAYAIERSTDHGRTWTTVAMVAGRY